MNTIVFLLLASLPGSGTDTVCLMGQRGSSFHQFSPIKQVMQQQPEQIVREFLTAVQQGQLDRAIPLLHPHVSWQQPGSHQFAGHTHSRDELVQMIGGMFQYTANSLSLKAFDRVSVNGNQVACVLHWEAVQEAGGRLSVDNIDTYTVKDGQITDVIIFSADLQQENTFWPN